MAGVRRGIHALSVASDLPARAHARTVLTGRTRSAHDVASAAVAGVGHRIDALPVAYGLSHGTGARTILT
jgi:hypothetical protein